MRTDPDYLKKLLTAFLDAPAPTTDIRELKNEGLDYDDPAFEFHMQLLFDSGLLGSDLSEGFGLQTAADGLKSWSAVPLRLTSEGQKFAEALQNNKIMEFVKKNLKEVGLSAIKDLALNAAKAELAKHGGPHL